MSDQALLSDLCSICNVNKSKYRCPGCSARTCSLPCYKRHQQWAQCTGKRDPTKYVKKSQLATPAGIDHDFNFLSGIERDLEKAEKAVDDKLQSQSASTPPQQTQSLDRQLAAVGIRVIRAPKGLSRQRENKTHRSKSGNKNIIWTVEWIGSDKSRTLTQTSAAEQISRAHPFYESPAQKRKRGAEKASQDAAETSAQPAKQPKTGTQPDNEQSSSTVDTPDTPGTPGTPVTQPKPEPSQSTTPHPPTHHAPDYTFYLLRPRTSSSRPVLIPLRSDATLAESLTNRTVLEFPTIYMFPASASQLPAEFMLEDEYIKQEGEEQRELESLLRDVDPQTLKGLRESEQSQTQTAGEEVDSARILDVLKRDLGAEWVAE